MTKKYAMTETNKQISAIIKVLFLCKKGTKKFSGRPVLRIVAA